MCFRSCHLHFCECDSSATCSIINSLLDSCSVGVSKPYFFSAEYLDWDSSAELGRHWETRYERIAYDKIAWMHRAHFARISSLWSAHKHSFNRSQWDNTVWRVWIAMRLAVSFFWPWFFHRVDSNPPHFAQKLQALLWWQPGSGGLSVQPGFQWAPYSTLILTIAFPWVIKELIHGMGLPEGAGQQWELAVGWMYKEKG